MFARGIGGVMSGRRLFQAQSGFSGNFASLFTSVNVLQSVQTDLGLTYGGTPLPTAGNISTTALTLTGALATVGVPIWAKSTNTLAIGAGAAFNIYYDGTGTTPAMVGVVPVAATPVPLTGAGNGLSLTWSAGTSVTNDTWKATCAALADQSAAAKHYSQAGATLQPLIATGLNGKPSLSFDGVNDVINSTLTLPAPGTTPTYLAGVWRLNNFAGSAVLIGDPSTNMLIGCGGASPQQALFNGSLTGVTAALPIGTFGANEALFSNSAADFLQVGSGAAATGATAGNAASGNRSIGANIQVEIFSLIYLNALPSPAQRAAFRAAVTAWYGAAVNV